MKVTETATEREHEEKPTTVNFHLVVVTAVDKVARRVKIHHLFSVSSSSSSSFCRLECAADNCRKRRSVRAGSFFEDSKIPLAQWLYIIYLWSTGKSGKRLSLLTGLSLRTIVTVLDKIRNICSMKILNDRQRETLVTRLVREFIEPGTVIISDKFLPYFNLNDVAHSNTIEGLWSQAKRKPKAMNRTMKAKLPGYLDEFNWSKLHPETNQGDRFNHMLSHTSEMVPLN
ncbi:hypothetical protein pdam_00021570 [Pocillopora damicornis]|uniref:ISXO2-like transposase domain-containing protein n=1 Tax=Pocillopora damicornis TaxID=46731 RepID=A0A3M6T4X9_POCDA|nr:hypothetical protein pdam_00021570 [Pocillopora damicornis]